MEADPETVADIVRSLFDILEEAEDDHGHDTVAVALGSFFTVLTGELHTFDYQPETQH